MKPGSDHPAEIKAVLRSYFALLFFAVFGMIALFWQFVSADSLAVTAYLVCSTAGYASLYTLAPLSITALTIRATGSDTAKSGWRTTLTYAVAYIGSTLTLLCLYADYRIYGLYDITSTASSGTLLPPPEASPPSGRRIPPCKPSPSRWDFSSWPRR